jgi:2-polyprenyl-3-methyl-5-hydroxy-6-metoxy-1,4-benzoquinol methylase
MEISFEDNQCICGTALQAFELCDCQDLNFKTTTHVSRVGRCLNCGSLRPLNYPTKETLAYAYRGYYTFNRSASNNSRNNLLKRLLKKSLRYYALRSLPVHAKSVLDYGCGSGAYLLHIKSIRPEITAYGTDIFKSDYFPEELVWIDSGELKNLESVDYITMGHVIEHLKDPYETVRLLVDKLDRGSQIWISTPNADSFIIHTLKKWARDIDFPRHRLIFHRKQLKSMLFECGLDEIQFQTEPRMNVIINVCQSLRNLWFDDNANGLIRVLGTLHALSATFVYLFSPRRRRNAVGAEIIAIAWRK